MTVLSILNSSGTGFTKGASYFLLVAARSTLKSSMPPWIAHLAAAGWLRVLDGGNCFNVYGVARALRCYTPQVTEALERIAVARAFTCYQMATLLAETPTSVTPTLVLDLLVTFGDENVKRGERTRLLDECISHLRRLSQAAPVAVSVSLRPDLDNAMLQRLEEAAGQSWRLEAEAAPVVQPRLFSY